MASDYRRQSQRFESKINNKLSEYEKLSVQLNKLMNDSPTFSSNNGFNASKSSRKSKNNEINDVISSSENVLGDIQQLLKQLSNLKTKIINRLESLEKDKNKGSYSSSSITSLEYILRNCETQYREFKKQCDRVENRIRTNIRRHKVLNGANRRRNANDNNIMDRQLEENQSLLQSISIVDDTLTMVTDAKDDLTNQGIMGGNINKAIGILGAKFPQANELMLKIKKYRNRDSIILACVCGVCLTLMFIYWLNK
eukprot:553214_1